MRAIALLLLAGCAGYVPQHPDTPLVIASDGYVKDGKPHPRGFLRSDLLALTADVPEANAYARAAHAEQIGGGAADVVSVAAGLATVPAAIVDRRGLNGVAANVFINTSLVFAALGPVLHLLSANRELDAVNAYNDRRLRRGTAGRK